MLCQVRQMLLKYKQVCVRHLPHLFTNSVSGNMLWFGWSRQKKRHAATSPPAGVWRRKRSKNQWVRIRAVEQNSKQKGTVTTTIQIRRMHKAKQKAQSNTHHPQPPHAPELRLSSRRPAPLHRNAA